MRHAIDGGCRKGATQMDLSRTRESFTPVTVLIPMAG